MAEKRVFISYRNQDEPFAAGRIASYLASRLGSGNVFRYIDTGGVDFSEIVKRLCESDVVLAVIGEKWRNIALPNGSACLDDPDDFLRLEIESAFGRHLPVIPVLIEQSRLGYANEFPDSLKPLARILPFRVSDRSFESDMEKVLQAILDSKPGSPPAPRPGDEITGEDLVLIWRSWRSPKHDARSSTGAPVYRFDVVIGAESGILDRIEKVVYYLPPAWPNSPAEVRNRGEAFRLKDIAWWDLTVRARVYVRDQAKVVPLSTHVWLWPSDSI